MTLAERRQRAKAAIARRMRALAEIDDTLKKADGASDGETPMRAVSGGGPTFDLRKAVEEGVALAFKGVVGDTHPMETAPPDPFAPETLRKLSSLVGFEVDAGLVPAAFMAETPVGKYLAAHGVHIQAPEDVSRRHS